MILYDDTDDKTVSVKSVRISREKSSVNRIYIHICVRKERYQGKYRDRRRERSSSLGVVCDVAGLSLSR